METFQIISVEGDHYELFDIKNHSKHEIILSFFDISEKLHKGDMVQFSKLLLNSEWEGYSDHYNFGPINSIYGKQKLKAVDVDVIKLIISGKVIKLKRLYG